MTGSEAIIDGASSRCIRVSENILSTEMLEAVLCGFPSSWGDAEIGNLMPACSPSLLQLQ